MKIRIVDLLKSDIYGIDVYVRGWVRTHRQSKNISFIALNDGRRIPWNKSKHAQVSHLMRDRA